MLKAGLILEMLGHIVFHLHLILGWFLNIILILIIKSSPVFEIRRSFVLMRFSILHSVSTQL